MVDEAIGARAYALAFISRMWLADKNMHVHFEHTSTGVKLMLILNTRDVRRFAPFAIALAPFTKDVKLKEKLEQFNTTLTMLTKHAKSSGIHASSKTAPETPTMTAPKPMPNEQPSSIVHPLRNANYTHPLPVYRNWELPNDCTGVQRTLSKPIIETNTVMETPINQSTSSASEEATIVASPAMATPAVAGVSKTNMLVAKPEYSRTRIAERVSNSAVIVHAPSIGSVTPCAHMWLEHASSTPFVPLTHRHSRVTQWQPCHREVCSSCA
jgi:hypothetical protein